MFETSGENVTNGKEAYVSLPPVDFIAPAGDPVSAPVDAGTTPASIPDGANEFTFNTAASGVLTMKLKAEVPGIGSMPAAEQAKFTFDLDTIGNSTFAWEGNSGGKATVSGDFITATATYTGLPQNNSDFGLKKARIKFDGEKIAEVEFEVFFSKDATNHPSSSSSDQIWPNWYYYWRQTSANFGTHQWTQTGSSNPTGTSYTDNVGLGWKCYIGQAASVQLSVWDNSNGIDTFANVCRHEDTHKNQMSAMWGNLSTRNPNLDTDGDYLKDSRESILIVGHSYDNTKKATYPDTFNYDPDSTGQWNDNEDYCLRSQPSWTKGAANTEDWSNPGMQHKSLNKADD